MSDEGLSVFLKEARTRMIQEMLENPIGSKLTPDERLAIADVAIKAGQEVEGRVKAMADMFPLEQRLLAAMYILMNIGGAAQGLEDIAAAALAAQAMRGAAEACDCALCVLERAIHIPRHITMQIMSQEKVMAFAADIQALADDGRGYTDEAAVSTVLEKHLAGLPGVTLREIPGRTGVRELEIDRSVLELARATEGATPQ